ncbi:GlsB/YeaQ/YmgE family stress response membrane protein [Pararoseomonas sp. SCSIO 73927]|uniref:GlsB/YeaQ/YmgE family stress response membrane protein n=1 Tax=Pararoseomonas sp. SCSIO 73927 TaxID=3114537 RepID=UPI0030D5F327
MSIIGWLILGLIAGRIHAGSGQGTVVDNILGIIGAVVGGFVFNTFGAVGVTGFNIYSMLVAIVGAVVVLWIYHAMTGRRSP